jgi:hypothetical protein
MLGEFRILAYLDLEQRLRLLQPTQPVLECIQPCCFRLLLLVLWLLSLQAEGQLWSAPHVCDPLLQAPTDSKGSRSLHRTETEAIHRRKSRRTASAVQAPSLASLLIFLRGVPSLSLHHTVLATATKQPDRRVIRLWEQLCGTRPITRKAGDQKVQRRRCRS